jgi:hypothetical protein
VLYRAIPLLGSRDRRLGTRFIGVDRCSKASISREKLRLVQLQRLEFRIFRTSSIIRCSFRIRLQTFGCLVNAHVLVKRLSILPSSSSNGSRSAYDVYASQNLPPSRSCLNPSSNLYFLAQTVLLSRPRTFSYIARVYLLAFSRCRMKIEIRSEHATPSSNVCPSPTPAYHRSKGIRRTLQQRYPSLYSAASQSPGSSGDSPND